MKNNWKRETHLIFLCKVICHPNIIHFKDFWIWSEGAGNWKFFQIFSVFFRDASPKIYCCPNTKIIVIILLIPLVGVYKGSAKGCQDHFLLTQGDICIQTVNCQTPRLRPNFQLALLLHSNKNNKNKNEPKLRKKTFDGRQLLMEDGLCWRSPLMKDYLWWNTTFDGRRP